MPSAPRTAAKPAPATTTGPAARPVPGPAPDRLEDLPPDPHLEPPAEILAAAEAQDPRPVSALPNLGPAADAGFARAGIPTAGVLLALGPDAAYRRLIEAGTRPHFIGFYAMVMGLQGRPWNDCRDHEKVALRRRFDAIKAAARAPRGDAAMKKGRLPMEAALDELGVRPA